MQQLAHHVMGGVRVTRTATANNMKLLLAVLVLSLRGLVARAQSDLCTAATNDPTHCVCVTPDGVIDVTSLGNANNVAQLVQTSKQ